MRLSSDQIDAIRRSVQEVFGEGVRVMLFGSRVDDRMRGGDVDLLVEVPAPVDQPAVMMARLSSRISRAMGGRKVDVVIGAPNLPVLPIHRVARQTGVVL